MKLLLARVAVRIERLLGRGRLARQAGAIVPYVGYATPGHIIVRGRVLTHQGVPKTRDDQSRLRNLWQMLHLFFTAEVAGVTVVAEGVTTVTDEEGYFTLSLPRDGQTGWRDVPVTVADITVACPVMVPSADAAFGVISDIDDTMMQTGAYSLWRNVWTSLTGNAATRVVFPDAVALMTRLSDDGRNPVHYVSSSPWNFYGFLTDVFRRNGLPPGPMFLRDYGVSESQFITGTHGDHKGSAIDIIMAALPDLSFVLIGDTGQHDAMVYLAAVQRHTGRVSQVVLRATADGVDNTDIAHAEAIRALGVPVHIGPDYDAVVLA